MAKDFRFGMSMRFIKSRDAFVEKVKRAEDVGFDILCVPDHLGAAAPIPALTAAAMVTTKLKLSMYVLNAAFYKPALLSRDLRELDKLSDGRLEIGLGTGYVKEEFEAAELPYPSAGRAGRLPQAHDDLPERASPEDADPHRGQRRSGADHRGPACPHHRADRLQGKGTPTTR